MSDEKREQPAENGDATPAPANGKKAPYDPRPEMLRDLHKYRLPPEVKEQILRELPPPEVREEEVRELIEHGGYTFEELIDSLPEDLKKAFHDATR
jgi:hypothetical protein